MRRLVGSLAMAVALAVAVAVLVGAGCGAGGGAPGYAAVTLDGGEEVSVADLRGRPALLVSWATWCRECDEELAGLQEFAASPAADGVQVVAVNIDAAEVDDEIAAKVERHGLTVQLWRDRQNRFRSAFGALGVPTTVVLDADGTVVGTFPGAVDFDADEVLAALDRARPG